MENIKDIEGSIKLKNIIEIFRVKRKLGLKFSGFSNPLLIIGESGIGKSQIVEQYAKEKKMFFVKFDLSNVDSTTFNGLMITIKKDNEIIHYHTIPKFIDALMKHTKEGLEALIFLDEINRSSYETRNAVFKLVINNEWGVDSKKLSENIFVIAAMNPSTDDYGDTEELDGAFSKRFIKINFIPLLEDWLDYAKKKNVHKIIIKLLENNPDLFAVKDINNNSGLDPRSWEDLSYAIQAAGKSNLLMDIVEMYSPKIFPRIKYYLENEDNYISLNEINNIVLKIKDKDLSDIESVIINKYLELPKPKQKDILNQATKSIRKNLIHEKTYAFILKTTPDEILISVFGNFLENLENSQNKLIIDKTEKIESKYKLDIFSKLLEIELI